MPSEVEKWLKQPDYPVIFPKPTVSDTVSSFRRRDYMKIVTLTSGSMVWGFLAGGSSHMRGSAMTVAGIMGATAGYFWAYTSSMGRLQGLLPNDVEVARYSSASSTSSWD